MNRKTYWMILLNPIFLILYGYGLSVVYALCKYGNVTRRLPLITALFLVGVLWFISWTILYFVLKKRVKKTEPTRKLHWVLAAEVIALIVITGYYTRQIYQTAQPYSGKLGSYLSDLKTKKSFSLDDSELDFMENGLTGIMEALADHCGLDTDWDLYTATTLTLGMDETGIIRTLEAFLYAFDEEGSFHSWLISFDSGKSEKMTVYLDGYADTTYMEQQQMAPLFIMIDALLHSDLTATPEMTDTETEDADNQTLLILKYSGYADGNDQTEVTGTWYTVTEENNGGDEDETERYLLTRYAAQTSDTADDGFLLSIYSDDSRLATIITGIYSMETISSIQEKEKEESEIETAKSQGNALVSNDSGMHLLS